MTFLLSVPVLVKVLGTLALILVLNSIARNLTLSIIFGTILLGLWTGHSPGEVSRIAWNRLASTDSLTLLIVVIQVIWLSDLMSRTGVMKDLVEVIQKHVSYRLSFAVLPAVIGLLPMPGGALFSAPLVDSCDRDSDLPSVLKTRANYWFRHIWEYWWPLYPGVLLAISLSNLAVWQFIGVQLPISLLAIGAGFIFILRHIPKKKNVVANNPQASFLVLISPVLVVIGSYIFILLFLPAITAAGRYIPIMIGLFLAFGLLQFQRRFGSWHRILLSRRAFSLLVLVAVIRIYGAIIEAPLPSGILLVDQMKNELSHFGIPILSVMIIVPFVCGFSMALTVGAVGASLPIVLNLLGPEPSLVQLLSTTILSYGCGYVGQLLSPMHVCLVVTNDYFKTKLVRSLGGLLLPCAVVLVGVIIFYIFLQRFG